jgi:hypothetical protein
MNSLALCRGCFGYFPYVLAARAGYAQILQTDLGRF